MDVSRRESVYDEKIYPLMASIIEICQQNQIPFIASFMLTEEAAQKDTEEGPLVCTSAILNRDWGATPRQIHAYRILTEGVPMVMMTYATKFATKSPGGDRA